MPCTYDGPETTSHKLCNDAFDSLKAKADEVTRLLCELTARIPTKYIYANNELTEWVAAHAKTDAKRKAEEKQERNKQKALLKKQMKELQIELSKLEE